MTIDFTLPDPVENKRGELVYTLPGARVCARADGKGSTAFYWTQPHIYKSMRQWFCICTGVTPWEREERDLNLPHWATPEEAMQDALWHRQKLVEAIRRTETLSEWLLRFNSVRSVFKNETHPNGQEEIRWTGKYDYAKECFSTFSRFSVTDDHYFTAGYVVRKVCPQVLVEDDVEMELTDSSARIVLKGYMMGRPNDYWEETRGYGPCVYELEPLEGEVKYDGRYAGELEAEIQKADRLTMTLGPDQSDNFDAERMEYMQAPD